ncbi:unnamed protein product [Adineta steineri]|uniref:Knr4/Smi1-like domain-containing protein n=1 Tax=Adineta steineri TaxID=433720 RepID=A0A815T5W6_9BILA|nr:unnamed protein product [Adineta steineri]CAF1644475.1 unnamed protein product [Adineta steineri]
MPPKRKATPSTATTKSKSVKRGSSKSEISSRTTIQTVDGPASSSDNNDQFKHLTLLESGHIDFVYKDNDDEDDSDHTQRSIYMILTPSGTKDKTSKRRVIFTKTENKEDQNVYYIRIENMANTGTSREASIINRDTIELVGQVAVGHYIVIQDTQSNKTHFTYSFYGNVNKERAHTEIEKRLINCKDGQNSFTIEIYNQEEYEKKVLEKLRENIWLWSHPERLIFDNDVEMTFIQDSEDLIKQNVQYLKTRLLQQTRSKEYEQLWKKINVHFKSNSKYQNRYIPGVSEYDIQEAERRLGGITLPNDIKQAIRIHNGRRKYLFGLSYRSPTTDLLPLDEWHPYENVPWCNDLFEQLVDDDDNSIGEGLMKDDLREHLKVYNDKKTVKNKEFHEMKSELLVIGEGMDDYGEQYLLGLRTGIIYLQVLNIPEWNKIGTFKDWIDLALQDENFEEEESEEDDD